MRCNWCEKKNKINIYDGKLNYWFCDVKCLLEFYDLYGKGKTDDGKRHRK